MNKFMGKFALMTAFLVGAQQVAHAATPALSWYEASVGWDDMGSKYSVSYPTAGTPQNLVGPVSIGPINDSATYADYAYSVVANEKKLGLLVAIDHHPLAPFQVSGPADPVPTPFFTQTAVALAGRTIEIKSVKSTQITLMASVNATLTANTLDYTKYYIDSFGVTHSIQGQYQGYAGFLTEMQIWSEQDALVKDSIITSNVLKAGQTGNTSVINAVDLMPVDISPGQKVFLRVLMAGKVGGTGAVSAMNSLDFDSFLTDPGSEWEINGQTLFADENGKINILAVPSAPVPEAEVYALFLTGLGMVGLFARRRLQ